MAIPLGAVLVAELHCLTHDGRIVVSAQRWTDPKAPSGKPRSWMRLVRNGVVRDDQRFTGAAAQHESEIIWAYLAEKYAPTALTEDQMWVALRELTGIEQTTCASKECPGGRMPTGWPICPACGRDARRVVTGAMSGVRGRGVIVVGPRPADKP